MNLWDGINYTHTMVRKQKQFDQAVELRKRGFTYDEIAKIVDVSKSTVFNWLSTETWSVRVKVDNQKRAANENKKRISLLNKARSNQHKRLFEEAARSAVTEFKHYKKDSLFVAGIALYMGCGDRTEGSIIRVTSSRMGVHRIFILFAEEYLGIPKDKIRFWLLLYPIHKEEACMRAWSRRIGLSLGHFHRSQIAKNVSKKASLHSGVGNTIIGGTVLKQKLMTWVELAEKEL